MGIAVNLVTYLGGTMHLPSATSANIVTDFMGTSFLLCLLGGFLADSFLGRYRTIAIFATVQTFVSIKYFWLAVDRVAFYFYFLFSFNLAPCKYGWFLGDWLVSNINQTAPAAPASLPCY